jgi:hypothetical protein
MRLCSEQHALTPEAIEGVIHLTERDEVQDHKAALESERKEIERRIPHVAGFPPRSLPVRESVTRQS